MRENTHSTRWQGSGVGGRKVDITLLLSELTDGGAERIMLNLAEGFVARGFETDLVVCRGHGPMRQLVPPTVRIVDLKAERPLTSMPELVFYLFRERPSALLAALTNVSVLALLATFLTGSRTRVAVREGFHPSKQQEIETKLGLRISHLLAPALYPRAHARIANSEGTAADLARIMGLPRRSITRIYNPALTDDIPVLMREPIDHPWFRPEDPPVILAAGRLEPEKDFATLLRAFRLARSDRDVRLVILGEGEARSSLEQLAAELGIAQDVALPGFVMNPFAFMARADVFVLSSKWEGFANVLVEALACGAAVVSTDCPSGPAEILDNGTYGRLVPVGDYRSMANAIIAAIEEPAPEVTRGWLHQFSPESGVEAYLDALGFSNDPRRAERR